MAESTKARSDDARNAVTPEYVRSILDYDPATGALTWRWRADVRRQANAHFFGKLAGSINRNGYRSVSIREKSYQGARVAWAIVTGEWPPNEVDHVDGNRSNDRWSNLRLATDGENSRNRRKRSDNTSGFKGVSWFKENGKWRAQIQVDGVKHCLGFYSTKKDAYQAYCDGAIKHHGAFARLK
jgi:hypothetical protein